MSAIELHIPLLNANERDAIIAGLHVSEGQQVEAGDLLYTLETTKSTAEVEAQDAGYVIGIQVGEGDNVTAGDRFAYLADSADFQPPEPQSAPESKTETPKGLRITDPARAFASKHKIDLGTLPPGKLITLKTLQKLLDEGPTSTLSAPSADFDPTAIIIYGGGGHGKSIIDLLRLLKEYRIIGILDDGMAAGENMMGVPILGGGEKLAELHAQGVRLAVNAVGGIGDVSTRVKVFEKISAAGFACPAIIHPTAFIEPSATLSPGVQVFPHAYVGSETSVGFGSIVNTGAIVSHDCILGDYTNIAPGAILAGSVTIGSGSLIGMGVTVNLNVTIGESSLVGNSATVKADVPANTIVRAGSVWPK